MSYPAAGKEGLEAVNTSPGEGNEADDQLVVADPQSSHVEEIGSEATSADIELGGMSELPLNANKAATDGSNEPKYKSEFFSDDLSAEMDKPWLSCLPWLDLSIATIGFACLGILIGTLLAMYANPMPNWVLSLMEYPGKLWVQGLKLLVMPLICTLMILVPTSLESDAAGVGPMGKMAIGFYVMTSTFGAIEGTIWGNIIRPGTFGNESDLEGYDGSATSDSITWYDSILAIGENAIPPNIVSAMASLNVLGMIVFFLVLGILLREIQNENNTYSEGARIIMNVCKALLRATMRVIMYFVWFTPIGMLSLVSYKCASTDDFESLIKALGYYILTATIAQLVHMFVFYPLLFFIVTRGAYGNGYSYWWRIKQAPFVAFATSSSAAALSVSLKTAREKGKVSDTVTNFVIPLGAAINMDGTGCGFPIMVLFIGQLYDINVNAGIQISIIILSVVCSIGTAPIPNAGMVYLVMLLTAAGNGLEDPEIIETAVATLFLFDWFVDRLETAQNVNSDQFVSRMVDHLLMKRQKHP